MRIYKGVSASPGLVVGQVSRLERHVETFENGPFNPDREQQMLTNAIHTAQTELESMAERSASTEQAIFLFQSMLLEDEGFMKEVRSYIAAGIGAAAAGWATAMRTSWQTWPTTPICSCAAWMCWMPPAVC